ncbi:MAG: DUF1761 family protein [Paracoccaceae bacterium]
MELSLINWAAVAAGTVAAYLLGMFWFSPKLFGKSWSAGSHNITPPTSPPTAAMIVQLFGTFALALVIGITETTGAIVAAIMAILATALIVAGMDLFSQKTGKATLIDAS